MNPSHALVMETLSQGRQRSQRVAQVICRLIVDGGKLGELETVEVMLFGEVVTSKRPPAIWFERLAKAIEVGAIERIVPEVVAARILEPPPASHA